MRSLGYLLFRLAAYLWAGPNTLLVAPVAFVVWLQRGSVRVVDGVLEIHGGVVTAFLGSGRLPVIGSARAMTIGHAVLGADARSLDATREHERVHVDQYERWGPFFLPAYFGSSLWAWARGQHPYLDNVFEREAFAKAP